MQQWAGWPTWAYGDCSEVSPNPYASRIDMNASGRVNWRVPSKSRFLRRHTIPPCIKNEIKLLHARRYLRLVEPDLTNVSSVLIVGAGASAEKDKVEPIAGDYDFVVTLNSALFVLPSAQLHSFEFAPKDAAKCRKMIDWLSTENYQRLLVKPHSLWSMSRENRRALWAKQRTFRDNTSNRQPGWMGRSPALRGIYQHHYPGYRDLSGYLPLINKERRLYQWRGSLSLWLDLVHRSPAVKRLGLIGTDFGGPYSSSARWITPSDQNSTHLLNQDRSSNNEPFPFVEILSLFIKGRYPDRSRYPG